MKSNNCGHDIVPRCLDEHSDTWKTSFLCSKCTKGCVPFETGICVTCQFQNEPSRIEKFAKLKIEMFDEEGPDRKNVCENDEKMFNQAMEIFHPYDEDFISLLNIYFRHTCCTGFLKGGI